MDRAVCVRFRGWWALSGGPPHPTMTRTSHRRLDATVAVAGRGCSPHGAAGPAHRARRGDPVEPRPVPGPGPRRRSAAGSRRGARSSPTTPRGLAAARRLGAVVVARPGASGPTTRSPRSAAPFPSLADVGFLARRAPSPSPPSGRCRPVAAPRRGSWRCSTGSSSPAGSWPSAGRWCIGPSWEAGADSPFQFALTPRLPGRRPGRGLRRAAGDHAHRPQPRAVPLVPIAIGLAHPRRRRQHLRLDPAPGHRAGRVDRRHRLGRPATWSCFLAAVRYPPPVASGRAELRTWRPACAGPLRAAHRRQRGVARAHRPAGHRPARGPVPQRRSR